MDWFSSPATLPLLSWSHLPFDPGTLTLHLFPSILHQFCFSSHFRLVNPSCFCKLCRNLAWSSYSLLPDAILSSTLSTSSCAWHFLAVLTRIPAEASLLSLDSRYIIMSLQLGSLNSLTGHWGEDAASWPLRSVALRLCSQLLCLSLVTAALVVVENEVPNWFCNMLSGQCCFQNYNGMDP